MDPHAFAILVDTAGPIGTVIAVLLGGGLMWRNSRRNSTLGTLDTKRLVKLELMLKHEQERNQNHREQMARNVDELRNSLANAMREGREGRQRIHDRLDQHLRDTRQGGDA